MTVRATRPLTLGRIVGRSKRALVRAFDALGSDEGDSLIDHLWRWLTGTYAGGIILIAIVALDIFTLLLLFWSPRHGG